MVVIQKLEHGASKKGGCFARDFEIKDPINQQAKRRFTYDFFLYARLYFSTQCNSFFAEVFFFQSIFYFDLPWFYQSLIRGKLFVSKTLTCLQLHFYRLESYVFLHYSVQKYEIASPAETFFFSRNLSPWLERLNSFQGWIRMEARSHL